MNDRTYIKVMIALGEDLERICSTEEYDQDAYNKVIESINRTNRIWWRSRRRYHWWTKASIVLLLCVLAWGFYMILHWLEI